MSTSSRDETAEPGPSDRDLTEDGTGRLGLGVGLAFNNPYLQRVYVDCVITPTVRRNVDLDTSYDRSRFTRTSIFFSFSFPLRAPSGFHPNGRTLYALCPPFCTTTDRITTQHGISSSSEMNDRQPMHAHHRISLPGEVPYRALSLIDLSSVRERA